MNDYLNRVISQIESKNPNEPEYLQAVKEVLGTVKPLLEKHSEYEKLAILERITEPERIFHEGFTTKATGSGLGLWICKKSVEEQMGELELSRSTDDYTEFTIRLGLGG